MRSQPTAFQNPFSIVLTSTQKTQGGFAAIGIVIIILLVVILAGVFFFIGQSGKQPQPTASSQQQSSIISGIINFNGVAPQGSFLVIGAREEGSSEDFQTFANNMAPIDNATWNFTTAVANKSYEIQVQLIQGGTIITSSDPIMLTAPAKHGVLTINASTQSTGSAVISGTIQTNGYIPAGAVINIEGRKAGENVFVPIAQNLVAQQKQFLTYATAVSGQSYDVQGELLLNGRVIGQSSILTVTAPAQNETLEINSKAQAPAVPAASSQPQGIISGTITMNGAVPAGSSVVILERTTGTSDYQAVVSGVSANDGAIWKWTTAQVATSYDLKAVLKQPKSDGTYRDVAVSNGITVSAPAQNQIFTINSGFQLPQPTGDINLSCGVKDGSSNTWTASVSFSSVDAASTYWFQIGTSNGGSDLLSSNVPSNNNPSQTVNVTLKDSIIYYARYAFANQTNPSSSQFSPFSSVHQFKCPK